MQAAHHRPYPADTFKMFFPASRLESAAGVIPRRRLIGIRRIRRQDNRLAASICSTARWFPVSLASGWSAASLWSGSAVFLAGSIITLPSTATFACVRIMLVSKSDFNKDSYVQGSAAVRHPWLVLIFKPVWMPWNFWNWKRGIAIYWSTFDFKLIFKRLFIRFSIHFGYCILE